MANCNCAPLAEPLSGDSPCKQFGLIAQLTQAPCMGYIAIAHVVCCHGNGVFKYFVGFSVTYNTVHL